MRPSVFFLALFWLTPAAATAQTNDSVITEAARQSPKNHFYLSPFNLIVGQFLIGYERDFNSGHGFAFLPGIIPDEDFFLAWNSVSVLNFNTGIIWFRWLIQGKKRKMISALTFTSLHSRLINT